MIKSLHSAFYPDVTIYKVKFLFETHYEILHLNCKTTITNWLIANRGHKKDSCSSTAIDLQAVYVWLNPSVYTGKKDILSQRAKLQLILYLCIILTQCLKGKGV